MGQSEDIEEGPARGREGEMVEPGLARCFLNPLLLPARRPDLSEDVVRSGGMMAESRNGGQRTT